jgi:hypothetical protein
LLINKRNRVIEATLPSEAQNASLLTVDEESGEAAARASKHDSTHLTLAPFAVLVISFP